MSVSVFYWHNITLYLQDPDADEPELPARDGSEHVAGGVSVHDLLGGDVGRRHDPVHGLLHGGARHRRHLQQGLLRRPGQPPLQVSGNHSKGVNEISWNTIFRKSVPMTGGDALFNRFLMHCNANEM